MAKKSSKKKLLTTEQELKQIVMLELQEVCSRWIKGESERITGITPDNEEHAMKNLYDKGYMLKRGGLGGTVAMAIVKEKHLISSKTIDMISFTKDVFSRYEDKIIEDTIDTIFK